MSYSVLLNLVILRAELSTFTFLLDLLLKTSWG